MSPRTLAAASPAVHRVAVRRVGEGAGESRAQVDAVAVEEPLEIRVSWHEKGALWERALAVTMRTPGHDTELAVGFLASEGIALERGQIAGHESAGNVVRIALAPGTRVDVAALERSFYMTSSCGVCGKASVDAIRVRRTFASTPGAPRIDARIVPSLPDTLRSAQPAFEATGGLHAAGLFDVAGALQLVREDVGRHNAVDKLLGAALLGGSWPLGDRVLVLSGRASFELLQKAALASIPIVASVGAPSSLAVELAREAGITLLGFVRSRSFNIYTGGERIG